jgi:competence protein ComEC
MMQQRKSHLELRGFALVLVALAWLAGILLDAWALVPPVALLAGSALCLLTAILCWRNTRLRLISLAACLLLLGAWRYALASPVGDPTAISAFIGTKKLELTGSVTDDPKLEAHSRLYVVSVNTISLDNGATWRNAHGLIEVQEPGSALDDPYAAQYGDSIELQGNLQKPFPTSGPDIFASMSFPGLTINQSGGNPVIAALYRLRIYLATIITRLLPQPMAALLIAIVLSLRTPTLTPLILPFNVTGTAHMIAPSGFKVTILAGLVRDKTERLFKLRKKQFQPLLPAEKQRNNWRQHLATGLVIASITGYTFLSGGSPAALRAGIMGIVLVLAPRFGRVYNVYNALAFTALIMSALDPFVLWDAGFQLSFFGTLGIIQFTPFLMRSFHRFEHIPPVHFLVEIIMVTLAAETGTMPIFATTFQQISFISPLTNILTVPLLAALIMLGLFMCAAGAIWLPLGMPVGWVLSLLLSYIIHAVQWCASLPGAYLTVPSNLNAGIAWGYYALLLLIASIVLLRWSPPQQQTGLLKTHQQPVLSKRAWRVAQVGVALVIMLATGATAVAARTNTGGQLTITFLNVGPTGQPSQGEAILIQTPDNKTALIDGGLDAASLDTELDGRLPFWQHTLDMVLLTSPRQDDLTGLQDIVSRYQVGEAIDAGMLHPTSAYALYRRTISERNIPYIQVRQGATITLGTQLAIQVFWPASPLHKSSQEDQDNGLIVRLVTPGLRMLLLGAAALSKYALEGMLATISPGYLAADIAQIMGESGKSFPTALPAVLQAIHPSLLIVSPAALSSKQRKAGASSILTSLQSISGTWQIVQTAQTSTIEIASNGKSWTIQSDT